MGVVTHQTQKLSRGCRSVEARLQAKAQANIQANVAAHVQEEGGTDEGKFWGIAGKDWDW